MNNQRINMADSQGRKKWRILLFLFCFWLTCFLAVNAHAALLPDHVELAKAKSVGAHSVNDLAVSTLPLRWQTVKLPFYQPRNIAANPQANERVSYFFRVNPAIAQAGSNHSYALYIPRWQTIGLIKVYADNQLVYASKTGAVWNGYNHPIWLTFESKAVPKQLLIRVDASHQAGMAISRVYFDEERKLYPDYLVRASLQTRLPETISSALLLSGLFAFTIWLRKRDEWVYLLFFAVSVFSHLRCLQYFVGEYPLLIPEHWFSWMVVNASGWTIVFTYAVCSYLYQLKLKKLQWCLGTLMLLISLLTLPILPWSADFGQVWSMASLVIFIVLLMYICMMVMVAWKSRSKEGVWLTGVFILNIPFGIHDLMLQNYQLSIESLYLLPYTSIGSMVVLLLIVRSRYLQAMTDIQLANQHLESKLAQREQELHKVYESKKLQEKQKLLLQERERLMKDMHDGFGSTLSTTLILLKSGQITPKQVQDYLEECISDLRLVIDSIEPDENTLEAALLNYAYRIHQKFSQAGITFHREIDAVPVISWLTPTHILNVLRILQEVFVNILKHASATRVTCSCSVIDAHLFFSIDDNGVGFDITQIKQGRGIGNIQMRAELLQAQVKWQQQAGGMLFTLAIPISFN